MCWLCIPLANLLIMGVRSLLMTVLLAFGIAALLCWMMGPSKQRHIVQPANTVADLKPNGGPAPVSFEEISQGARMPQAVAAPSQKLNSFQGEAALALSLLRSEDGPGLAGVTIHCPAASQLRTPLVTDADGLVTLQVPAGVLVLLRCEFRQEPGWIVAIDPLLPNETRRVTLVPSLEAIWKGRACDALDGRPLADVEIGYLEEGASHCENQAVRTVYRTSGNGTFLVYRQPRLLVAIAKGYTPLFLTQDKGYTDSSMELCLKRSSRLRIIATGPRGEPRPGVRVHLEVGIAELMGYPTIEAGERHLCWDGVTDGAGELVIEELDRKSVV